eukprot:2762275-Rhodomonas_salina.2
MAVPGGAKSVAQPLGELRYLPTRLLRDARAYGEASGSMPGTDVAQILGITCTATLLCVFGNAIGELHLIRPRVCRRRVRRERLEELEKGEVDGLQVPALDAKSNTERSTISVRKWCTAAEIKHDGAQSYQISASAFMPLGNHRGAVATVGGVKGRDCDGWM